MSFTMSWLAELLFFRLNTAVNIPSNIFSNFAFYALPILSQKDKKGISGHHTQIPLLTIRPAINSL